MKEYLESALRQAVILEEDTESFAKLPIAFRGRYNIYKIDTNGVRWLAVHPKGEAGLVI